MAKTRLTSLEDFEPFFGNDKKGAYAVQAMYNGTDYKTTNGPPSALMIELLRADNYKTCENTRNGSGVSQGPDDVPQDFTDLVINTALFHRSIDQSTSAGTNIPQIIKGFLDNEKNMF